MSWPFPMESAHPMLVHAPIALLLTATMLDVAALVFRRPAWHRVALWNLTLGAIAAAVAVFTGLRAEAVAKHSFEIHEVMEWHERMGLVVANLAAALAVWRLVTRDQLPRVQRVVATLLGVVLAGVLAYGAHLGRRLVYEFGVGGTFGQSTTP